MIYNRLIVAAIGFIRLEPYDGKLSRTVLRGGKDSNALLLPDYASVEMLYHPEYAGCPMAVGGDPEARHGIILTANYIAKKKGVKTGQHSGGKNSLFGSCDCSTPDGSVSKVFFYVKGNLWRVYESG